MFGKSLFDLISDKRKQEFADSIGPSFPEVDSMDQADIGHEPEEHGFKMQLRKKRKTALLKQMLADGGYGDLAKMVTIKEF